MKTIIALDFETFSTVDIKKAGHYKYAQDTSFEILLTAYSVDKGEIIVDEGLPTEVKNLIMDEENLILSHNSSFERAALAAYDIIVPVSRFIDTAILATACGLPRSLGKLSEALELGEMGKKSTGAALIRYFCMPCKPTKVNGGRTRNLPEHNPEKWDEFKEYAEYDILSMRAAANFLYPYYYTAKEQMVWELDQKINDRGVRIHTQLAKAAIKMNATNVAKLKTEMQSLTGLENPLSPVQLKGWLADQLGEPVESLNKSEMPALLEKGDAKVKKVLEMRNSATKTSVKKFDAMLNMAADKDARARGLFVFYGASRTGRFAGKGIQLQNLKRPAITGIDTAREFVIQGDDHALDLIYGDVSEVLSQLIRSAIIPKPGNKLVVSDLAAIEARVLAWLAGETWALEAYANGRDIYKETYAQMSSTPYDDITKDGRAIGKTSCLACGYAGGVNALKAFGADSFMSQEQMRDTVAGWRKSNKRIVKLWSDVEAAAKRAIITCDTTYMARGLEFSCDDNFLSIKLPSGRSIRYFKPTLGEGRFGNTVIFFMGQSQTTYKWEKQDTYGGKLTENITQAVARDILVEAMLDCDTAGMDIILSVHDEIGAESSTPEEDLDLMNKIFRTNPDWAEGLPLDAEGYISDYYKK